MRFDLDGTLASALAWAVLAWLCVDGVRQLRRVQGRFEDLPVEDRVAGVRAALAQPEHAGWWTSWVGRVLTSVAVICVARGLWAEWTQGGAALFSGAGRTALLSGVYTFALANVAAIEALTSRSRRALAEGFMMQRGKTWRRQLRAVFDQRNRRDPDLPAGEQTSVLTPFPLRDPEGPWGRFEFLQWVQGERLVLVEGPALDLSGAYLAAARDLDFVPSLDLDRRTFQWIARRQLASVRFRPSAQVHRDEVDRGVLHLTLLSGRILKREISPDDGEKLAETLRWAAPGGEVSLSESAAPEAPSPRQHLRSVPTGAAPAPGLRIVRPATPTAPTPDASAETVPCHMCAEPIRAAARICRFCYHPVVAGERAA